MPLLNSGIGNYVCSGGKRYSYFAGNNYLGLANHPEVKSAAIESIKKYGVNFSASRCTTGTADIHLELERQLSIFKKRQDAIVYASGYQGNGILLETLKKRFSAVYIDESAHPSITKSIPREVMDVCYYNHLDTTHLERLLDKHKETAPLIITDGIFALTGEIAPLDKIYYLAEKHNALLIVDDAHSTGILGKTGMGTPDYYNLSDKENIYQTETMSKALGSYGGFIAGTSETIESIREGSTTYQASTALPPPVVAASIVSLKIILENPELRVQLLAKALGLRKSISLLGYQTTEDNTPVIPIMMPTFGMAKDLSLFLEDNGIIVPFIHYPVRTETYIVRIAVSVSHTNDQTEELLSILKKWKEKYGKN
jgi:7-keto-8-aminopelargonate synthetase-like enzyme